MNTTKAISLASKHLTGLPGRSFDILNIAKPSGIDEAADLAKLYKIISKVSPLVGNLIEHDTIEFLNQFDDYKKYGTWVRQDQGFPDIVLDGSIRPTPGFEVKTWYPFSTEITGRFKDSQNHFKQDQTYVILLAWLPEHLIYGNPKIVDILIVSGRSIARARDNHYHNPPGYIVLEPEDTSRRTKNLQQTNTNGYKFQMNSSKLQVAKRIVESWGKKGKAYKPTAAYQQRLRTLIEKFTYRLDTNFAKMDRVMHPEIESFKKKVLDTRINGLEISQWLQILSRGSNDDIKNALVKQLKL